MYVSESVCVVLYVIFNDFLSAFLPEVLSELHAL